MKLTHLEWRGAVLRRQPPIRLRVCQSPPAPAEVGCAFGPYGCKGHEATCVCGLRACAFHARWHRDALPVPPDAWRRTLQSVWANAKRLAPDGDFAGALWEPRSPERPRPCMKIGTHVVSTLPPWRLDYCRTPSAGYVDAECGHEARTCDGPPASCLGCGFSYCRHHHGPHVRHVTLPGYVAAGIIRAYRSSLDELAQPGALRRGIKVPAPRFRVL